MATNRLPRTLIGAPSRAECCPAQCEYRVEVVQHHLDYLTAMRLAGEDPSRAGRGRPLGRDQAGGTVGNGDLDILDVQVAIEELRAERREVTATAIATKLCPFAVDS